MNIVEESTWEGRPLEVSWHDSTFIPPRELITQASGLCFTNDSKIVLVTTNGKTWQLAGGQPEVGETIEHAFVREVAEEACATVNHLSYLGTQEVNDPYSPTGLTTYYQVRFWARVTLDEFRSEHEMLARKCTEPLDVKTTLNWHTERIFDVMFQSAIEYEKRFIANQETSSKNK